VRQGPLKSRFGGTRRGGPYRGGKKKRQGGEKKKTKTLGQLTKKKADHKRKGGRDASKKKRGVQKKEGGEKIAERKTTGHHLIKKSVWSNGLLQRKGTRGGKNIQGLGKGKNKCVSLHKINQRLPTTVLKLPIKVSEVSVKNYCRINYAQ